MAEIGRRGLLLTLPIGWIASNDGFNQNPEEVEVHVLTTAQYAESVMTVEQIEAVVGDNQCSRCAALKTEEKNDAKS